MHVEWNGRSKRFTVAPGEDGRARFERAIRDHFQLSDADVLEFKFECADPEKQGQLILNGRDAFGAAFHCAAITAARRDKRGSERNVVDEIELTVSDGARDASGDDGGTDRMVTGANGGRDADGTRHGPMRTLMRDFLSRTLRRRKRGSV